MSGETRTCSICGGPLGVGPSGWTGGNNAEPINHGRCCDACNQNTVIPLRMIRIQQGRDPRHVETDIEAIDGAHRRQ